MSQLGIGRLQAALASATNEVTVAAANINFDFSLVKCEPPAEYQPLALQLSSQRKAEAESGSQHVTARRLGALFEGLCPAAPRLIAAFGKRASEISEGANTKFRQHHAANWIFSEYVGVDATSLWAAATSSKAALPLYLLACMLARVWDDAAATSLWVEIVAERRREIVSRFEAGEALPFATTTAAAQQEISRDQLAKWDASARAWLRTADDLRSKERRQFLLIADNIELAVNDHTQPYHSIIAAWVSAVGTLEKLIAGEPHAVQDGSVLLGISSWHIYPDMSVFGAAGCKTVLMNDPLVHPGGVISLGITNPEGKSPRGVFWSLSLAHHKFYGKPVRKSSQLNGNEGRLSFAELQIAAIGAILARWRVPVDSTDRALKCLLKIASVLPYNPKSLTDRWIEMIITPVMECLQGEDTAASLISLGRRRDGFIPAMENEGTDPPIFGLTNIHSLLPLIPAAEDRVRLLWRIVGRLPWLNLHKVTVTFEASDTAETCKGTVVAPPKHGKGRPQKRARHSSKKVLMVDGTELNISSICIPDKLEVRTTQELVFGDASYAAIYVARDDTDLSINRPKVPPEVTYEDITWCIQHSLLPPDALKTWILREPPLTSGKVLLTLFNLGFASMIYRNLSRQGASISPKALLKPFTNQDFQQASQTPTALKLSQDSLPQYMERLSFKSLVPIHIIAYFETGEEFSVGFGLDSFLGIAVGDSIYVPTQLLTDPAQRRAGWVHDFSRLLGNLGRPGLTVLSSPKHEELQARDIDPGSWRTALCRFQGEREDAFSRTSLHLSFTDWQRPLFQLVGQRDSEVNHVEAFVSIRDSGCWVADVNVMWALRHASVQGIAGLDADSGNKCTHHDVADQGCTSGDAAAHDSDSPHRPETGGMLALETWDQILDVPEGRLVAKSFGNWVSRLAIMSVLAHHCRLRTKRIYVCPENLCWACVKEKHVHTMNSIYIY